MNLTIRNQISPPLQATKWLKVPLLVEVQEMRDLLNDLGQFWIFLVSAPVEAGQGILSKEEFLNAYHFYIESLKQGQMPEQNVRWRTAFSSIWTVTTDALYSLNVAGNRQLIKVERPVLQLQPHQFDYSEVDGKFRSMVYGMNSITWGIQFSYPQLFQDSQMQIQNVKVSPEFPNTALFKQFQKWVRNYTIATPFRTKNGLVNVPIRLGKNCLEWINRHPQLQEQQLKVEWNWGPYQ